MNRTDESLAIFPVVKWGRVANWAVVLKSHFRRLPIEVISVLINHDWLFRLIGALNRRVGLIQSVFLVYPGNEKYSGSYLYQSRIVKAEWEPWPCGLLWQNRRATVMFCITASSEQFTDTGNTENLVRVVRRMENLRELFGAKTKTFAGILPGVLYSKRFVREAPEADLTAVAVSQAITLVKSQESLGADTPIIVLGHRGFIGRRVVKLLQYDCVYGVDKNDSWPHHLRGRRAVVINVALNGAINCYVDMMWPGMVVLNEVYPEPGADMVEKINRQGCALYHVTGVAGKAFPPFPEAYEGGIPCCAAWASPHLKVVIRKLSG